MTTKRMVESAWAEDRGQFLYCLDPDTRKITRVLEKIINRVPSSLTKLARIYIYIYIYTRGSLNKYTYETLVLFEVISSGCNILVVPFQQLLEGPMEVLLCERINDLRHSLFHLNYLITTASEFREIPKVTGRLRNYLDANLGQIVCDEDGVVDRCIVQVEMPLSRFEECWPRPTESLPELS